MAIPKKNITVKAPDSTWQPKYIIRDEYCVGVKPKPPLYPPDQLPKKRRTERLQDLEPGERFEITSLEKEYKNLYLVRTTGSCSRITGDMRDEATKTFHRIVDYPVSNNTPVRRL